MKRNSIRTSNPYLSIRYDACGVIATAAVGICLVFAHAYETNLQTGVKSLFDSVFSDAQAEDSQSNGAVSTYSVESGAESFDESFDENAQIQVLEVENPKIPKLSDAQIEKNQQILNDLYKNIKNYDSGVFNYDKKIN